MFRLHNKIEKSEIRKISSKRLQFILALGRFVTYTFLSARGVAQLGSATALGAVGRWFESSHPDHFFFLLYPCGGSSIGRASAFQADCCGFESRPPLHKISYFKLSPVQGIILNIYPASCFFMSADGFLDVLAIFSTAISVFTDILLAIFFFTCHDQLLIYFLEYSCN